MAAKKPLHIAIVGGGIGGLCTALSIHHYCGAENVAIDVYEQAAQYKEIGAGVGIGINAAKLIHRIGLGDEANAICGHRDGVWISFRRYDNGDEVLTVPSVDQGKVRQLPVHRAEFLDLLYQTIKTRNAAMLHTNKACVGVKEDDDTLTISFKDGSTATADFVVGCDGIHSVLRSQYSTDEPRYSGRIAYRELVDMAKLKDWWPFEGYSILWMAKHKHLLVFPVSQNKLVNVVAFVSKREQDVKGLKESWTATGKKTELMDDFREFEPTVQKILQAMPENPARWILNDREPLEQWVFARGRICLMGDAAHAMLPHQGAGAGQAIEDGYILARALKDFLGSTKKQTLEQWAHLYQTVRLPRAQKVQRTSREAGDIYEMQADGLEEKSYNDCVPEVAESIRDRMKWVWTEDIDDAYDKAKVVLSLA